MNCNRGLSDSFYENRFAEYISQTPEKERTEKGAKDHVGASNEKWEELKEDEGFKKMAELVKELDR